MILKWRGGYLIKQYTATDEFSSVKIPRKTKAMISRVIFHLKKEEHLKICMLF